MIKIICLDADDTLWHNVRHFNAAIEACGALLLPFAEASVTQAALEEAENRNWHAYGYGAESFTLAMIAAAVEVAGDAFSRDLVSQILDAGRTLLSHPVELFEDIDRTSIALKERGDILLVTKGDLLHQETKLPASGFGDLFAGVEIVSDKTEETFQRLFTKYNVAPSECIMAGDSMRSDVLTPLRAGALVSPEFTSTALNNRQGTATLVFPFLPLPADTRSAALHLVRLFNFSTGLLKAVIGSQPSMRVWGCSTPNVGIRCQ